MPWPGNLVPVSPRAFSLRGTACRLVCGTFFSCSVKKAFILPSLCSQARLLSSIFPSCYSFRETLSHAESDLLGFLLSHRSPHCVVPSHLRAAGLRLLGPPTTHKTIPLPSPSAGDHGWEQRLSQQTPIESPALRSVSCPRPLEIGVHVSSQAPTRVSLAQLLVKGQEQLPSRKSCMRWPSRSHETSFPGPSFCSDPTRMVWEKWHPFKCLLQTISLQIRPRLLSQRISSSCSPESAR